MDKFDIQDKEYAFPYHYIPEICGDTVKKKKELRWACEYLAYTKFIASKVIDSNQDNCLDVGCGDGRLCNMIRSLDSDIHIKGIDLSGDAISWTKIFNPQVEFEAESVTEIKDKWKIITCVETIEHIPDEELDSFFIGLSRALDEGG